MSQTTLSSGHAVFEGSLKVCSRISSNSWGPQGFGAYGDCNFKLCTSLLPWGLSEFYLPVSLAQFQNDWVMRSLSYVHKDPISKYHILGLWAT